MGQFDLKIRNQVRPTLLTFDNIPVSGTTVTNKDYIDSQISSSISAALDTVNSTSVIGAKPSNPLVGDLWYDSANGGLYLYYSTDTWIQVNGNVSLQNTATTTTVSATVPSSPTTGSLWLDTNTGQLLVYTGQQWIQPSYSALAGGGTIPTQSGNSGKFLTTDGLNTSWATIGINQLSDVDTVSTPPATGQVLKWNGSNWVPSNDPSLLPDLTSYATLASPTFTGYVSGISAAMVGLGNVTNESKTTMFTSPTLSNPTFTGTTTLQQSIEILNLKAGATGTVVHDFSTGAVWWHTSLIANFTANFTNVPAVANRVTTVSLILNQGSTGYYPSAVQVNSASVAIRWPSNITPIASSSKIDIATFSLIYIGSTWYVLGNYSNYN
jgi:hypothetical protein